MITERNHTRSGALFLVLAILLSGCDQTFEPLQPNDRYFFSIYGYLESGADTNWVRVVPVGESLFISDPEIDGVVMLEHLEGGTSIEMQEKLFQFAEGVNVWNFWTTETLLPDNSYRLRAERSDGMTSAVTVRIPADFPDPEIVIPPVRFDEQFPDSTVLDEVLVRGAERIADVQAIYQIRDTITSREFRFSISHLQDTLRTGIPGEHVIEIDPRSDMEELERLLVVRSEVVREFDAARYKFVNCQLYVAVATSDFPNFHLLDFNVIALPEGVTNVEDGVGFLAAVVSKTVPYPTHPWPREGGLNPDPCPAEP